MCPYVEQRTYPTLIRWMLGLPSQPHRRRRIYFVSAAAAAPSLQTCRSCPAKAKLLSRTSAEVISANFRTDLRQHSLSWVTKWERVSEIVHPLPRIKVLWGNVWLISQGSCSCWSCAAPESNFFFFFCDIMVPISCSDWPQWNQTDHSRSCVLIRWKCSSHRSLTRDGKQHIL